MRKDFNSERQDLQPTKWYILLTSVNNYREDMKRSFQTLIIQFDHNSFFV